MTRLGTSLPLMYIDPLGEYYEYKITMPSGEILYCVSPQHIIDAFISEQTGARVSIQGDAAFRLPNLLSKYFNGSYTEVVGGSSFVGKDGTVIAENLLEKQFEEEITETLTNIMDFGTSKGQKITAKFLLQAIPYVNMAVTAYELKKVNDIPSRDNLIWTLAKETGVINNTDESIQFVDAKKMHSTMSGADTLVIDNFTFLTYRNSAWGYRTMYEMGKVYNSGTNYDKILDKLEDSYRTSCLYVALAEKYGGKAAKGLMSVYSERDLLTSYPSIQERTNELCELLAVETLKEFGKRAEDLQTKFKKLFCPQ